MYRRGAGAQASGASQVRHPNPSPSPNPNPSPSPNPNPDPNPNPNPNPNQVTIVGVGFLGFSPNASEPEVTAEALTHLRVRFGSNVQRDYPLVNYSDTEIVCITPWGTEDVAGVP